MHNAARGIEHTVACDSPRGNANPIAIAIATRARLRQIPFTPARVRQALAELGG